MKKIIFTSILILTLSFQAFSQKQFDITKHYEDFISIKKSSYKEKEYLTKRIIVPQEKSELSELISNNTIFIDYVLKNFSSNSNHQRLLNYDDSLALKSSYFSDLKKDSLFNSVMTNLAGKTIDQNTEKDSISTDELMNIAVKYFTVKGITDDGNYEGKVCGGINGIKDTEPKRKPFLEAFCFSAILKHYRSEEYNMYEELVKSLKELNKLNLGTDDDEKLMRAQGGMFLLMKNNTILRDMLMVEYNQQKQYLPFVLKDA